MDIRKTPTQQVMDAADWMRELAEMDTPTAMVWAEVQVMLKDISMFLHEVTLPKLKDPPSHLRKTEQVVELDIIRPVGPRTEAYVNGTNAGLPGADETV